MRKVPLFLLACLPLAAEVNFSYDPDAGRWTLRNSVMEAAVELSPEGVLSVRELRDLRNGDAWAAIDRAPARLQIDGELLAAGAIRGKYAAHVEELVEHEGLSKEEASQLRAMVERQNKEGGRKEKARNEPFNE